MDKIKEFFAGKKTYLIAVGAIIAVIVSWSTGGMDTFTAIKSIVEAVLAMTIRAGVAKVGG